MKCYKGTLIVVALILGVGETKRWKIPPPVVQIEKNNKEASLPDPSELARSISPLSTGISMFLQAWELLYSRSPKSRPTDEKYTVLIPKDIIFRSEFPPDTPNPLLIDTTFQKLILHSHIVHGKIVLPDVKTARIVLIQAQTLDGKIVEFDTQIGYGFGAVNGVPIVARPLETSHLLLYVIDDLLFVSTDDIISAIERTSYLEPQGPPITFKNPVQAQLASEPKPPAIPLYLEAPAPPIDGPLPPAIPDPEILAQYGLLDDDAFPSQSRGGSGKRNRGNVRFGVLQHFNDPDKDPKVKSIQDLPEPPAILRDNTIQGPQAFKKTKYNQQEVRRKTAKNQTESALNSLGIYQFLTAAVVAQINFRGGNLTLITPSDRVLQLRNISLPQLLLQDPVHAARFIRNHILNGTYSASELVQRGRVVSQAGEILNFDMNQGVLRVNGIPVSKPNVVATNGMMHILDGVLDIPSTSINLIKEDSLSLFEASSQLELGENTPRIKSGQILNDDSLSQIHNFAQVYHLTAQTAEHNIATVLQNNNAATLLSLLERADLIGELTSGGPYTILAPNDKAFAHLAPSRLQELTTQPDLLKRLLSYHVINQSQQEDSEVVNDSVFRTLLGSPLRFNIHDNMVLTAGAKVIIPDQDFSQGVIHVIDSVLMPPVGDLTSTMIQKEGLERFITAFAVNKTAMLGTDGPWTIIAPLDAAFDALTLPWMELILHHKIELIESLKAHVIPGGWYSRACSQPCNVTSITGHILTCSYQNGVLSFNGVPVIESDITSTNGVLHTVPQLVTPPVLLDSPKNQFNEAINNRNESKLEFTAEEIDIMLQEVAHLLLPAAETNIPTLAPPTLSTHVVSETPVTTAESEGIFEPVSVPSNAIILPPTEEEKQAATVWQIIEQRNLTIFSKMLITAGLKDLFTQSGPWTVFAPNNVAWSALPSALLHQLSHDQTFLNRILSYHISNSNTTRLDMKNELILPSLSNDRPIRINLYSDGNVNWFTASGNKIINLDEMANNGVVHIVDGVLYPPHGDLLTSIRLSPILMTINMIIDVLGPKFEQELAQLPGPVTAFIPNDEILMEIDFESISDVDRLSYWLKSHIVTGSYYRDSLQDNEQLITLTNRTLLIQNDHEIHMNGADLVAPDITLTNGVLHIVNVPLFDP